jgi:hypothetical protein
MQMLLAAMLINADHAAFENRIEAFQRVCVDLHAGPAIDVAILTA